MLSNTPTRIVVTVAVVLVVVTVAEVLLILGGHAAEAIALPGVVAAIVPPLVGQDAIHGTVAENTDRLNALLNGGTEAAVRKVVREELTTLVAADETHGTTTVTDAAANLPDQGPGPVGGHYGG